MKAENVDMLEGQIGEWRRYLEKRREIQPADIAELEDHLREDVAELMESGLDSEEAFLVTVKRLGRMDALSREFAREHSDRLWKQLVVAGSGDGGTVGTVWKDALVALCYAAAAGALIKAPALFGLAIGDAPGFYLRNLGLFTLPLLTAYFAWKRSVPAATLTRLALPFAAAALVANAYPFSAGGSTEVLTGLHLPIALWLVTGIAYAGGQWHSVGARMNFIRFSGELFIYYVLIALGGAVLSGMTVALFSAIGINMDGFLENWLLPCGAAGGFIVAAWLVEAKQSVIENMAPVLTRIFAPLFTLLLAGFLAALLWTGNAIGMERDLLIAFDLLLVVVLGLLLYSISAREPGAPPGPFDALLAILLVCTLLADMLALSAIAGRIHEFGLSPNRIAALGENLILLVNLGWATVLQLRFIAGRGSFTAIERWQTAYLPVYAAWAAVVVLVFPPLFGFI